MKPKVLISVPNYSGWVHKFIAINLLKMQQDARIDSTIIFPTNIPYINNLHKIIRDFLKGSYDFWITMDDDNPPRNNVLDLVFLDKDVIGCPTPVWHNTQDGNYPIYWNAMDKVEDGYRPHKECKGLQEIDAVGSGCMVIARRVIEALDGQKPFMRTWGDDGIVIKGGDFTFCDKVKAAGFKIYAHYDYPCYHFNEVEIGEIQLAFQDLKK